MSEAATILAGRLGGRRPRLAIVLGSSLGSLADRVAEPLRLPYAELPGFPRPSVSGHAGELVAGSLGGRQVMVLKGRAHPYETGDAAAMRPVIEALAAVGVGTLLLTNAAGSLVRSVGPGRLLLITDHLNLSGLHPLLGEAGDERFVPMTAAYDPGLLSALRAAASRESIDLAEGVYAWMAGPVFETPAEIRMLRILGADAVGMSTVPEVILARRLGLKVAAVSAITNLGAGLEGAAPSHEETKAMGARAAGDLARLVVRFLEDPIHDQR